MIILGTNVSDFEDFHDKKISKSTIIDIIDGGKNSGMNTINTVNLTVLAEKAGSYTGQLVIYTIENVHDVRVLEFKIQAFAPKKDLILNFKSPARKEMTQVKHNVILDMKCNQVNNIFMISNTKNYFLMTQKTKYSFGNFQFSILH